MTTYKELIAEKKALDARIEAARVAECAAVVQQIRDLLDDYGLTIEEVMAQPRSRKPRAMPAIVEAAAIPALYQHPETGKTWSGRGRAPAWLGANREKFRIGATA